MSDVSLPGISFVFPMWNEEEMIHRTVAAAHEAGRALVDRGEIERYEIVIVDDASTDATGRIADELAEKDHVLRVVHHEVNRKLGGAMRTGYAAATGATVLCTGADLPFDLLELLKAFRILRTHDADIVSAYRFDRTGEGPRRFIYSHLYNWLTRATLGLRVRDVNFAGKLVRREVLGVVELRSDGSFIDVELLAKADRQGFRIVQFGVDYFPRSRGVSTLSSWPVILDMIRELVVISPSIRRLGPPSHATRKA